MARNANHKINKHSFGVEAWSPFFRPTSRFKNISPPAVVLPTKRGQARLPDQELIRVDFGSHTSRAFNDNE